MEMKVMVIYTYIYIYTSLKRGFQDLIEQHEVESRINGVKIMEYIWNKIDTQVFV